MGTNKVSVIAEIANAHQGDPALAMKLAQACAKAGADAIKFQIYFAEELLVQSHQRYEHFKNQSFSPEVWTDILKHAKDLGVEVYADVFGLQALSIAQEHVIDGVKIHSSDLSNTKLLRRVGEYDKKLFLATGGSTIPEIKYALDQVARAGSPSQITLLHGFQAYPTEVGDSVLCRLATLKDYFGDVALIGYSDHVDADSYFSTSLPLMTLPYGVSYIEKHVTLDRAAKGVDYYSSYEPAELSSFIENVRVAEQAIGCEPLSFSDSEKVYRETVKKQWVVTKDMKQGQSLDEASLVMLRTQESVSSPSYESLTGSEVVNDLVKDSVISKYDIKHKVLAVVVARFDSSRLPGKATCAINDTPAIGHLLSRLEVAKSRGFIDTIAFCTTTESSDDQLVDVAEKFPCDIYRGAVEDVLSRMMLAIDDHQDHDIVLRITGDDLLVDPDYLHQTVEHHLKSNAHYTDAKELPSGTEVEVFDSNILKLIYELSRDSSGSEYLTNYIKNNADQFCLASLPVPPRHAQQYRLTLDTPQDYEVIKGLLEHLHSIGLTYNYTLDDICDYFDQHPEALRVNQVVRQKAAPISVDTDINWGSYTKMPLVTVYITNHNYGRYLQKAIDSVLSQKFRDFEVIIIDDGSTDDSRRIIEPYRNHSKVSVVYQENKGLNVTCNIALKLSRGKYIMRLDADDYLDENALLVMVEMLERQGHLAIVFPDYYNVDEKGEILSHERRHDFKEVTLLDQPAHGACTMIRKSSLLEVGGYNEEFNCQDGYDLWVKFTKNHEVANVNLPLFYYRQHDKSLTKDQEHLLCTRHELIKQHTVEYDVSSKKHLCILPIRSLSDKTPLATRPFADSSLLELTLKQIQQSENVTHTVVTSPDKTILECAERYALTMPLTLDKRPASLCGLNTHIERTVDYLLEKYFQTEDFDTLSIVNYEYPLRNPIYLDKAINTLYLYDVDAVIGVEQKSANFYRHNGGGLVPFKTNRELNLERDFVYEEAGGIHSIRLDSYRQYGTILCGAIGHIVLDSLSVRKVESEADFEMLELLSRKGRG